MTADMKPLTTGTAIARNAEPADRDRAYRLFWHDVCRYVRHRFGPGPPEPHDVAQQAFLHFAEASESQEIRNPGAYLRRAAHNIVIDEQRRLAVRRSHAEMPVHRGPEADELDPERILLGKEAQGIAYSTIEAMPGFRRRVLLLNRIHGLTAAEIARRMGKPESTVRSAIARALEELQAALDGAEP